ncbi:MAG: hypothetical protein QG605_966 [Euryarchaeota archaeon]|nr:hypothetical protein [Euryarchaeota archaeon]
MEALKLSFAAKVFMSLIAGAICGSFFGEKAQFLAPIGRTFSKADAGYRFAFSCDLHHHRHRQH